jgi:hypothetical protein
VYTNPLLHSGHCGAAAQQTSRLPNLRKLSFHRLFLLGALMMFRDSKNGVAKFEVPGGLVAGTEESRGKIGLDRPNRQWE